MVQDLLDWAQIKSNKFRKNIQNFNIIKAVEAVIQVQLDQAKAKGLELFAEFVGINERNATICSDQ